MEAASIDNERKILLIRIECIIAQVYSQIAQREGSRDLSMLAKNIGFLFNKFPFADKKAEDHLKKAIDVSKEIGMRIIGIMMVFKLIQ